MKNYYKILNLDYRACKDEIKKAYHKLALKFHPDMNLDNKSEAEERFKEINEANEVLSDETKKIDYDYKFFGRLKEETAGKSKPYQYPRSSFLSDMGKYVTFIIIVILGLMAIASITSDDKK